MRSAMPANLVGSSSARRRLKNVVICCSNPATVCSTRTTPLARRSVCAASSTSSCERRSTMLCSVSRRIRRSSSAHHSSSVATSTSPLARAVSAAAVAWSCIVATHDSASPRSRASTVPRCSSAAMRIARVRSARKALRAIAPGVRVVGEVPVGDMAPSVVVGAGASTVDAGSPARSVLGSVGDVAVEDATCEGLAPRRSSLEVARRPSGCLEASGLFGARAGGRASGLRFGRWHQNPLGSHGVPKSLWRGASAHRLPEVPGPHPFVPALASGGPGAPTEYDEDDGAHRPRSAACRPARSDATRARLPPARLRSTRSAAACTTCGSPSPTAATSAARTACRRRSSGATSPSCRASSC